MYCKWFNINDDINLNKQLIHALQLVYFNYMCDICALTETKNVEEDVSKNVL